MTMSLTELLVYGALALIAPYAIFAWCNRATRVVFKGEVNVSTIGLLPRGSVSASDFFTVFMPDGTHMMLEATQARMRQLGTVVSKALITVKQPMIGARYISSVTWPGEKTAESGETTNGGLYLSITYLMLAMGALAAVSEPANALVLGHFGNAFVALLVVVSGWAIGALQLKPMKAEMASAEIRMLGFIPLGKGAQAFVLAGTIAVALTGVCMWYGGALALVGLATGFAAGQLAGMALRPTATS